MMDKRVEKEAGIFWGKNILILSCAIKQVMTVYIEDCILIWKEKKKLFNFEQLQRCIVAFKKIVTSFCNYFFIQDTLSKTQTPSKLIGHLQSKGSFAQVFQSRIFWVGHFSLPLEDYNHNLVKGKKKKKRSWAQNKHSIRNKAKKSVLCSQSLQYNPWINLVLC